MDWNKKIYQRVYDDLVCSDIVVGFWIEGGFGVFDGADADLNKFLRVNECFFYKILTY